MELVTIEEFIKQVWEIEHVKIQIKPKNNSAYANHLVRPYNFERLSGDATVDDLKERINYCINEPFLYMI